MPAKYSEGTVVRIKISERTVQPLSKGLGQYKNQIGKVLNSKAVVAYTFRSVTSEINNNYTMTIYMYTIELEDGITLSDITEFQLEPV